ncbi:MAG TPA: hypothetical protein VFP86_02000 [bacterium]|nr:hypothetical protein [bacterium]
MLVIVLLVCLAAQVVVGLMLVRSGGFWSPDSAVRFVQVESLLRSHYGDLAVPYPAQAIDPQGIYFPMGRWFHAGSAGRFYLSYLPYFSMASALVYRLLGFPGLVVLPAAAVLGTVWITYHVLRRRAPDLAWAGALAVGLASPVFVYGVVFWDHTLVVFLAAGALALLCGEIDRAPKIAFWRMTAAGVLLGLGVWLRNEVYLLALAVAVAWLYAAPRGRFRGVLLLISGAAVPALALWALNTHLVGSPFGWKGNDLIATRVGGAASLASGGAHAAVWLREKMGNAYYQLASPDFYAFNPSAVAVGLAMTVALLLGGGLLRMGVRRQSPGMIVAGAIAAVGTGVLILSGRTVVSGLLPAAPIVVLAFLTGPVAPWERFLWGTSALFCAEVIVTGTHGGMQWGPRYLLPILPPLVWLAAAALARARAAAPPLWPTLRLAAAALAAVSLLLQAAGVDQVLQASARNARINGWLRGVSAQIIITPLEWLTLGAGGVYFEKDLMLVQTPEALSVLVQHLSQQHVTRWAYVPFSGLTFSPMAVARWTDGREWRFRPVGDHFYEGLRIVTYAGSPRSP